MYTINKIKIFIRLKYPALDEYNITSIKDNDDYEDNENTA